MSYCTNCQVFLTPSKVQYKKCDMDIHQISTLEHWIKRELEGTDSVCEECYALIKNVPYNTESPRLYGHTYVCSICGISVLQKRHHKVKESLRTVLAATISPREVLENACTCYKCWKRIKCHIQKKNQEDIRPVSASTGADDMQDESVPAEDYQPEKILLKTKIKEKKTEATIEIPGYRRASVSAARCLVLDCENSERLRVNSILRTKLLCDHKLYVTKCARICQQHSYEFDSNTIANKEYISSFTGSHVSDMLDILCKKSQSTQFSFENFTHLSNSLCVYLTGLSKDDFKNLLYSHPAILNTCKNPKTALAAYLIKLKRNEPHTKISALLSITEKTLIKYLRLVEQQLGDIPTKAKPAPQSKIFSNSTS